MKGWSNSGQNEQALNTNKDLTVKWDRQPLKNFCRINTQTGQFKLSRASTTYKIIIELTTSPLWRKVSVNFDWIFTWKRDETISFRMILVTRYIWATTKGKA